MRPSLTTAEVTIEVSSETTAGDCDGSYTNAHVRYDVPATAARHSTITVEANGT